MPASSTSRCVLGGLPQWESSRQQHHCYQSEQEQQEEDKPRTKHEQEEKQEARSRKASKSCSTGR